MYMRAIKVTLTLTLVCAAATLSSQNGPAIPDWIHPGLTVTYDSVSAFVNNGRFSQGVQMVMTTRVNSVSGNAVSAVTYLQSVGTPIGGSHAWVCNAAGNCRGDATGFTGKFWVDPAHPTESIHGANGEPYTVMGRAPYTYAGRTWDAVTMSYQNPGTGVQLAVTFDGKSGLVLAYAETSPAQQVHLYFRAISGR
jgi:hypothetical protein